MKTHHTLKLILVCLIFSFVAFSFSGASSEHVPNTGSTSSEAVKPQSYEQLSTVKDWVHVRIYVVGPTSPHVGKALEMGFILATEYPPVREFFDLLVPRDQLMELADHGWDYETVRETVPFPSFSPDIPHLLVWPFPPEYHMYEELTHELDSLYQAYPGIAFMESLGVTTLDKRVIWGFKVSDNVEIDEDEPAVLYVSTHHGCEMIGMEYCLYLIKYLLTNYGINRKVTAWIDETEIWFVPLFNPDGYWAVYSDVNHGWRKNARDTNDNGIYYEYADTFSYADHDGVDLNRNYSFGWELGGSTEPLNWRYRGESPFSEDENKAMFELATREMFQIALTFHSFGEVVVYPWDWDGELSPDHPVFSTIADSVASRIPKEDGSGSYDSGPPFYGMGLLDNWMYGDLGTICMSIEVNPAPIMIEPADSILPICLRLFHGTTYLLDRVHEAGVTGVVTDSATGLPVIAEIRVIDYYDDIVAPRMTNTEGRFYRYLIPGEEYTLKFIAPGYDTVFLSNVIIHPESLTTVNVAMTPTVGIEEGESNSTPSIPLSPWLDQNYPNPFNPTTTITFDVPITSGIKQKVQLIIYDIRGKQVIMLVDAEYEPGSHRVFWNGTNEQGRQVSSGIYLYTLRSGNNVYTRKMVLLK